MWVWYPPGKVPNDTPDPVTQLELIGVVANHRPSPTRFRLPAPPRIPEGHTVGVPFQLWKRWNGLEGERPTNGAECWCEGVKDPPYRREAPARLLAWGKAAPNADGHHRQVWRDQDGTAVPVGRSEQAPHAPPLDLGPAPLLTVLQETLQLAVEAGAGVPVLVAFWGAAVLPVLAVTRWEPIGVNHRCNEDYDTHDLAFNLLTPDFRRAWLETEALVEAWRNPKNVSREVWKERCNRWKVIKNRARRQAGFWQGGLGRAGREGARNQRSLAGVVFESVFEVPAGTPPEVAERWYTTLPGRWADLKQKGLHKKSFFPRLTSVHRNDLGRPCRFEADSTDGKPRNVGEMLFDRAWASWASWGPQGGRVDAQDAELDV